MKNIDNKTVEGFGDEWSRFDQTGMSEQEAKKVFEEYFICRQPLFMVNNLLSELSIMGNKS